MGAGVQKQILFSAGTLLKDFACIAGKQGVLAAACVLAGAILEGIGISLLIPLLGLLFNGGAAPHWLQTGASAAFELFHAHDRLSYLLVLLGTFALLMVLRAIVISARDVMVLQLQLAFVETQQMRVATDLASAPWEFLARLRHARIAQLMGADVQRLAVGIHFVVRGAISLVILLVQCALAFLLAPILAGVILLVLFAGAVGLRPTLAKSRSLGDSVADANLSLLNTTAQFMGGLKLAISQNLQESFVDEIKLTLKNLSARQIRVGRQQVLTQSGLATIFALIGTVAVFAGLFWLHVAPSLLIALLLIVARMTAPVIQIQQAAQQFVHLLPVYERIDELRCELCRAREEERAAFQSGDPEEQIVFENVTCSHRDPVNPEERGAGVLRDFNITIGRGEFLGVTGASGGGKTTFADLLAGLYPPQSGHILVGGKVLGGAMLAAWRKHLSYVPQDPFLFHDTLRRNLCWANALASESEMWRALAMTGADDLVRRMERGLDTIVGERGALVSGGERQRIALARALLRRPSLLILDEATNALDGTSEGRVLSELRNLVPRPTIVLIAHRTENLAACDRVVRLESSGGRTLAAAIVVPAAAPTERIVPFRPAGISQP